MITVREILDAEFFKDYKVIAGNKGLDNQVRGITVLDSECGYKWTQRNEFVFTTGYIFSTNPNNLEEYLCSQEIKKHAALAIKERYIREVPNEMLKVFNDNKIPLIFIPPTGRWVEIFNAINAVILNKIIKKFDIGKISNVKYYNLSYQERKIKKILNIFEYETSFPAMLFDLINEKAYYSSNKFKEETINIKIEEYWNPSFSYSKEYLFNNSRMARYKLGTGKNLDFSWINIPIMVDDKIKAYFVIIEPKCKLSYFDQFALSIGLAQLQAMYEQILVVKGLEYTQFTQFMNKLISGEIKDKKTIILKAIQFDINIYKKYCFFIMKQSNKEIMINNYKDIINSNKKRVFGSDNKCHIIVIDEYSFLFLYELTEGLELDKELELLYTKIDNFYKRVLLDISNIKLYFGLSDICGNIVETERSYMRCLKALEIGPHLFPNDNLWVYSKLGILAWLDIKEDEMEVMKKDINKLKKIGDVELIQTLKVYVENRMNFSSTADKMFLHINTVRARIEKVNNILNIDLNNELNRLKLELILKFLE
ncbi:MULTISPECIES: PucR family transcriptional regulator [unclassified Sedimentibacter]|uniref:PucR family transcriptional regulator n=1 Tax=unclassified Sedimentibacter TaxID=2649220 RepID=UPI0027E1AECF|nr:PucR family transcriptional regulator [Sedimentibacter sp. MB35-C1]WMJ78447.1 PucR family transcriptional regulator ligand-binding domain-containing protein [Sedimentibacter sp. MB35-C1]